MSYEEAFEALRNGDFLRAVPLLEKAAVDSDYSSDIVNHAYTLALYRARDNRQLAEVSFRLGNLLVQQDPASAMDYFQRAIVAGLDAKHVRLIGGLFEKWAAAAERPGASGQFPLDRVAHVVGALLPADATTQYVKVLSASLKKQGISSTVFTTEWSSSWFFNPEGVPTSHSIPIEADVKIASVAGDFLERAVRVADAIRASGSQVTLFHSNLSEQITARVASLHPTPIQVNVNHGTEMDADFFDGRIHLFKSAMERTRFTACPMEWIPPASDIETRLRTSERVTRQGMGLESASTVSATFGDLNTLGGDGYLRVLTEIMKRFPKHFHFFAGAGNVKAIRSHLHSEGVLPRIRFLGQVGEVAPLLHVIDIYLASFPSPGTHSILEAMGAGKPVVILRFLADVEKNSCAELVGIRELIAPGEANYIEIADRLLRDSSLREKQGEALLERFRAEFAPDRLGERYKACLARFRSQ